MANTTVTLAQEVVDGSLTVAVPPAFAPRVISGLPPFCRVAGVIRPTTDSNIAFEVWLPLSGWNGRFAGTGNGMLAGSIIYAPIGTLTDSLAMQLSRGYAVANSDMGHAASADPARFAYEHPEQLVDFGWRATHELTVKGKAITTAFYGAPPARSYWFGCSTGGRQGLMEAQRFPEDYDGIVAGSPANTFSLSSATMLDNTIRIQNPLGANLSQQKSDLLAQAVISACDANDGVVDGLLDDPRKCKFDPGTLQCGATQDPSTCLTASQVESARSMYAGLMNPVTGTVAFPGRERGSESMWAPFTTGPVNVAGATSYTRWAVFADPSWDWSGFDFRNAQDFAAFFASDSRLVPTLDAANPDLRAFRARGGRLIQYHGWADNNPVAPRSSINYFASVAAELGEKPDNFYRLFMVPGMTHCYSPLAPGPNVFDAVTAIENWVEKGIAPERIVAAHVVNGVSDRTRPLCRYPSIARWLGTGSIDEAENFVCSPPVDVRILPALLDLRAGVDWALAFISLGSDADAEGWVITDAKLEGSPAISVFRESDGRTFSAKFSHPPLDNVGNAGAVTLSITGTMSRNGAGGVPFVADASVYVVR